MMQTNMLKLRGKIVEAGLKNKTVAQALDMDPSTFYRKMKSKALCFTVGEMHQIVDVLNLSKEDACAIFLEENSQ